MQSWGSAGQAVSLAFADSRLFLGMPTTGAAHRLGFFIDTLQVNRFGVRNQKSK